MHRDRVEPCDRRDPSGRFLDSAAEAAALGGEAVGATATAGLLAVGIAGYAVYNIYNQIWDWQHPIISHADPGKPAAGGKESCPDAPSSADAPNAENSGGGAKVPPAAQGDVGADAPDPRIPQKALDALQHIQNNGSAPPGMQGGRDFANDGRGNGEILPETDADGNEIRYREWDVNKYQPGVNRGPERIVTGSDGSAYYTGNHYGTFVRIP
jgi:guanyl-specific ribonuclease Sa